MIELGAGREKKRATDTGWKWANFFFFFWWLLNLFFSLPKFSLHARAVGQTPEGQNIAAAHLQLCVYGIFVLFFKDLGKIDEKQKHVRKMSECARNVVGAKIQWIFIGAAWVVPNSRQVWRMDKWANGRQQTNGEK